MLDLHGDSIYMILFKLNLVEKGKDGGAAHFFIQRRL